MKSAFYVFFALFAYSAFAEEVVPFCHEIELIHGYVQFIRIENSDEFEISQPGKYLHILKAKTKENSETQLTFDHGSMKQHFIFEQNCEQADIQKKFNLEDY
jgi:hypothetical protein